MRIQKIKISIYQEDREHQSDRRDHDHLLFRGDLKKESINIFFFKFNSIHLPGVPGNPLLPKI